ncbi:MAG TPA: MFS transporter [Xanthobacteraceae bacterium]|jgi:MFS family permease|nr:MFS transporter [Xanthobacteraceae bacterium]
MSLESTAQSNLLDPEATGSLAWYKTLTPNGRRTFWACFAGWGLDAVDAQIYTFIIPALMSAWSLTGAQIGVTITVGWVSSAIGGWLGGILADRIGRIRALQIAVLWFAGGTLLCAITQSYEQLLVARAAFGLGFGGEWAIGAALVGEVASPKYRGTAVGVVHSAYSVGWAVAALLYPLSYAVFPENMAWRALFAFGFLPAIFVFYIRRFVDESPMYLENRRRELKEGKSSFLEIFSRPYLVNTILAAVVSTGIYGATTAIAVWLPTFLKTVRHLSVLNTSAYLMVFILSTFVGYVTGAYLSDRIGRRWNFIIFAVGEAVLAALYTYVPVTDTLMLFLGVPLGICFAGVYGGVGALMNELFPTRLRGSGIGFCFNFGRGVGTMFGFMVGLLSASMSLGPAIALLTACACSLIVIGALLLPETKGRLLS